LWKIVDVPKHETPEQYKKRTGKNWPDEGAVWFKPERPTYFVWGVCRYITTKRDCDKTIICVQSPEPPPDDFMPEVE
jgi:hypothetical protein